MYSLKIIPSLSNEKDPGVREASRVRQIAKMTVVNDDDMQTGTIRGIARTYPRLGVEISRRLVKTTTAQQHYSTAFGAAQCMRTSKSTESGLE